MTLEIFGLAAAYFFGCWFAPFPHWPTYFILWRHLLFNRNKAINFRARVRQARLLLFYLLFCPFWTLLWYLDELLFPAYRRQAPKAVFIIGQPRSGSTFLHRTLGEDDATFFAIRHFEWRYPYLSVQKLIMLFGLEHKLQQINYWPNTETGLKASKMHRATLYDYQEDGVFWEECFLCHFFVGLHFPYPVLIASLEDFTALPVATQERMMKTYQKAVQKVTYSRGAGRIYLSKETVGKRKAEWLCSLYEDAQFVISVRHSTAYMSSLMALLRTSTLAKTGVHATSIPNWEAAMVELFREDTEVLLKFWLTLPPDKQTAFEQGCLLMKLVPSITHLYQRLGCQPSPQYLDHLHQLQNHQTTRDRGYEYQQNSFAGFDAFDTFVADIKKQHEAVLLSPPN